MFWIGDLFLTLNIAVFIIIIFISVIWDFFIASKRNILTVLITIEFLIFIVSAPLSKDFMLLSTIQKIVWIIVYLFVLLYGGLKFIPDYMYGRQESKKYEKRFPDEEGGINVEELSISQETPHYYLNITTVALLLLFLILLFFYCPRSFQMIIDNLKIIWNLALTKKMVIFMGCYGFFEYLFDIKYLRKSGLIVFLIGLYNNVLINRYLYDVYSEDQKKIMIFLFSCSYMLFCSPLFRTKVSIAAGTWMILFEISSMSPHLCQFIYIDGDKQFYAEVLYMVCVALAYFWITFVIAERRIALERFLGKNGMDLHTADRMYILDRKYTSNIAETTMDGNHYYFHNEKILAFYYCPFPFLTRLREYKSVMRKDVTQQFTIFPYFFIETEKNWYLARQKTVDGTSFFYKVDLWKELKDEWERQMGITNQLYRSHPDYRCRIIKPFEISIFVLNKDEIDLIDKKSVCYQKFTHYKKLISYPVILSTEKELGIIKPH